MSKKKRFRQSSGQIELPLGNSAPAGKPQKAGGQGKEAATEARRRILILDDHPIMRLGLTRLIGGEPDLTVCGETADARQALSVIAVTSPHLVIADIAIPGLSVIEFIKEVRTRFLNLPVLILSNYDELLYGERMIQAGARGYVMKCEGAGTLLSAVRQVLDGRPYLSPTMMTVAFEALGRRAEDRKGNTTVSQLSDREFEVLQCFADGKTTREAASELGISAKTVETHRLSLCRKLGLKSVGELIRYAVHWDETSAQSVNRVRVAGSS